MDAPSSNLGTLLKGNIKASGAACAPVMSNSCGSHDYLCNTFVTRDLFPICCQIVDCYRVDNCLRTHSIDVVVISVHENCRTICLVCYIQLKLMFARKESAREMIWSV